MNYNKHNFLASYVSETKIQKSKGLVTEKALQIKQPEMFP